ncbi:MAG: sensor histidine kinase, partial [Chitinophagales bacterium]
LVYANRAEQLALKIDDKKGLLQTYYAKESLYQATSQPGLMMKYHHQAAILSNELSGKTPAMADRTDAWRKKFPGDSSFKKNLPPQRKEEREQIVQMLLRSMSRSSKDSGADQQIQHLAEANEMVGNYEDALKYHQMYDKMKDSLAEAQQSSALAARNAELKNEALQVETLKVKEANTERIFLISGIVLLLIISGITYSRFVVKKRSNKKLELAYQELRSTQDQLIRQEKLASLGQLTAGIAHEIRNPLNFVNNFSELSHDLVEELLSPTSEEEKKEIAHQLRQNLEKITHHGQRADRIVRNMLDHARTGSSEKQITDINELCEEYLMLSFHGFKAGSPEFNCGLEMHFDPDLPRIKVAAQDLSRVLLNLFSNAFQAVKEKPDGKVNVTTAMHNSSIQIHVKDNGRGIPESLKEKIFEPFFTTKSSGEGTGLGLSISYDIVKAHGGEIKVNSKENEYTQFIVQLPL